MKLIVGLGNPGRKYAESRHNVGYKVLAGLAQRYACGASRERFHGELVQADIEGAQVLLLRPLTFMNRSGDCVRPARDYFQIDTENLLVVCDDFHLPVAKLRFRAKGSSGGQKGLQDIIERLGTEEFPRLRIGIGPPPEGWDPSDFVLRKFAKDEKPVMKEAIARAVEAAAAWAREGVQYCMNRYNAN